MDNRDRHIAAVKVCSVRDVACDMHEKGVFVLCGRDYKYSVFSALALPSPSYLDTSHPGSRSAAVSNVQPNGRKICARSRLEKPHPSTHNTILSRRRNRQ